MDAVFGFSAAMMRPSFQLGSSVSAMLFLAACGAQSHGVERDAAIGGAEAGDVDGSVFDSGIVDSGARVDGPVYVKASNTRAGGEEFFGAAVSLSADGTRLAVGAPLEGSSATGVDGDQTDRSARWAGAAYVFVRSTSAWTQEAYIKASNTGPDANFGSALSLSGDGRRLVVGAPGDGVSAGAVYVFERSGPTWTQDAYLRASNPDSGDQFGSAVSLSADGMRLAVGAPDEDSAATGIDGDQGNTSLYLNSGATYVFSRSGTTWAQEAYVKASNSDGDDGFGRTVSLSADGFRLAVGAPGEDSGAVGLDGDQSDDGSSGSGAVYVLTRSGATWTQDTYMKASNSGANDRFGGSLSLSADGTLLGVGAYQEASRATGIDGDQADDTAFQAGAVYVFTRTGPTWAQEAYLKASNSEETELFGISLSMAADGTRLAVGAEWEDSSATGLDGDQTNNEAGGSGAVYVFSRSDMTWAQNIYVKASNTDANDVFGSSVSLSADATRLAVGAFHESSAASGINGNQADNSANSAGAVYIY